MQAFSVFPARGHKQNTISLILKEEKLHIGREKVVMVVHYQGCFSCFVFIRKNMK